MLHRFFFEQYGVNECEYAKGTSVYMITGDSVIDKCVWKPTDTDKCLNSEALIVRSWFRLG